MATLLDRGYSVLEQTTEALPGQTVVRFLIRRGIGLEAARDEIAAFAPQGLAEFNHYYRPEGEPACKTPQCTMRLVGWPLGSDTKQSCSSAVTIGIVDTGINVRHAALKESSIELIDLHPDERGASGEEHGTALASILVGSPDSRSPGLLPQVRLIAVDAFRRLTREGDRSDAFDLARAIGLMRERGVGVVNLSLSGPANAIVERAVAAAAQRDIVIVAAAGNQGPRAKPLYPAAYPEVIAVTAVDQAKRIYRRAAQGEHIDLAAPGVRIWTAASVKGAKTRTGTSFAAPFVTAAAALLRSRAARLDRDGVRDVLERTALDLGEPGKDQTFGSGLLQAGRFCQADLGSQALQ